MVLIEDIKEAWLSSHKENIEDELKAVFKARDKTDKNKIDKVDETELLELLAKKKVFKKYIYLNNLFFKKEKRPKKVVK